MAETGLNLVAGRRVAGREAVPMVIGSKPMARAEEPGRLLSREAGTPLAESRAITAAAAPKAPPSTSVMARSRSASITTARTDDPIPFGGRDQSACGPRERGPRAPDFHTTVNTARIAAGPPS